MAKPRRLRACDTVGSLPKYCECWLKSLQETLPPGDHFVPVHWTQPVPAVKPSPEKFGLQTQSAPVEGGSLSVHVAFGLQGLFAGVHPSSASAR